jgi:hypothetical protein
MTPGNYTDLDILKQIAAQGSISAAVIDKMLNPEARMATTPAEIQALQEESASLPENTRTAIAQLKVLQTLVITAQSHVAPSDPHHYSDGRPVVSIVDAGGSEYKHVWQADPDHPFNHPSDDDETQPAVAIVSNSAGQLFKLFVADSHKIGVLELGDEQKDRL